MKKLKREANICFLLVANRIVLLRSNWFMNSFGTVIRGRP